MSKSKTIYYDAIFTGLVPVRDCKLLEDGMVQATVSETVKAYKEGEIIESFPYYFVNKLSGLKDGIFLKVCKAEIK